MRIALFLPHVGVFGGVRRFIELGNAWARRGHSPTLYHPAGSPPSWLPFAGEVLPLDRAIAAESDLAFSADPLTFESFVQHSSKRHVYYCVIEGDALARRGLGDPRLTVAANSGPLLRSLQRHSSRPVLDGIGGIDVLRFRPDRSRRTNTLRVLLNGRRSRAKKGTDLILSALRALDGKETPFEVVLFDTVSEQNRQDPREGARLPRDARYVLGPTQDELVALYQSSDIFVAAERKAGWCNTALEAMACGCAVVCTPSGTSDFARNQDNALVTLRHPWLLERAIRRLLREPALRSRLSAAGPGTAAAWTWDRLAGKLLDQLGVSEGAPAAMRS
ncbi:MAG TPA: glycosyltransferase family 4 protein [Candidatus Udaeobacter sp.]|jgi:glycosyltransferase involved in cell wall biosynthesis|nr:glycosyltransferase family 4 protein [Candidatus Udaeobacter sp.]